MKKISLCIFISFMCALINHTAYSRDFIIIANPQEPYKFKEGTTNKGIDVEVIDIVMKRLGIPYKIMFIKSDARIQEEARKGKADMLLLFSKKKSRQEYLIYPEQSYVNITWNFFIRSEDEGKIKFKTFDDLKDIPIGATVDISYTPEFHQAGLKLEMTTRNDLQIGKLLLKRFDAVPMNTISTLYEEREKGNLDKITYLPKALKSKPYYNVFTKASDYPNVSELIEEYSSIIKELKANGTIDAIFAKYLGK
ncbi:MAG: ABC transporter substrate-binding protein [Halopseudomonas aestusnigri]